MGKYTLLKLCKRPLMLSTGMMILALAMQLAGCSNIKPAKHASDESEYSPYWRAVKPAGDFDDD